MQSSKERFANQFVTEAADMARSQRTPHEGVWLAWRDFIRYANSQYDLPTATGLELQRWSAELTAGSSADESQDGLVLATIRQLEWQEAERKIEKLIELSKGKQYFGQAHS